jgi:NADPH-dependent 2,4-dienoyl-CoA reductase/sulfur reductase-like enzyme/CheY-like chemotaxis protein
LYRRSKMKKADVVIVGGSAAGIEAAIVVQKHYKLDKVIVIRKESKVLVPCGIPYIMGTLQSIEKNVVPDALLGDAELIIDEVASIHRGAKTVTTAKGETIGYDKLILATGSRPVVPPIPGADLGNVFTVKKDMDYLQQLQDALKQAKDVVIVGGGFIGAEFADECRKMGLNVTVVELLEHCLLLNCDDYFCTRIEDTLREHNVHVNTICRVASISGGEKVEYVECEKGLRFKADVVILAIGVTPNNELARDAGLEIGERKGIMVDQYMRTSDPDIFAIGDCAEKFCFFTRKPVATRLASIATREARIAVANLFELRWSNEGTMGVFGTMIVDTAIGVAGLTERAAREAGYNIVVGEAVAVDKHPGSMPGAKEMRVRLIFERRSEKMIGGEACGGITAGEISNVMASAIANGMTAEKIVVSPMGTHPMLTASPLVYQIVNAAAEADLKLKEQAVLEHREAIRRAAELKPILVVDDEAILRESLRDWLISAGYTVQAVERGEEALKAIEEQDFGVAILDFKLPGKNGIEVLREARVRRPQLQGILITAYPSWETAVESMKLGAVDYLSKPFSLDTLEKLVQKALVPVEARG